MDNNQGERSAIGGTSQLGGTSQQRGTITFGIMPEQVQAKLNENPGAEFLVIQRVRQGEEPQVWSSGDPTQTEDLFRTAYTALAFDQGADAKEHETT